MKTLSQIYSTCRVPRIFVTQLNQTEPNYLICLAYEGKNNKIPITKLYQQPSEVYITNHKVRLSNFSENTQLASGRVRAAHSDSTV